MERIKLEDLKNQLKEANYEKFLEIEDGLRLDPRKNIQALILKEHRRYNNEAKKLLEYNSRKVYENKLLMEKLTYIAGIDEVGRGPLAGPVYTAAVILDPSIDILGIKDSKKLSEKQRESLAEEIKQKCLCYSIGIATEDEIDHYNILGATKLAMRRAIEGLSIKPQHILIDALKLEGVNIPQTPIIKGDDLSISIGAASIVAKVERDSLMNTAAQQYPEYSFDKNKGYGTSEHIEAIKKHGPCKIHRNSFIKNFV